MDSFDRLALILFTFVCCFLILTPICNHIPSVLSPLFYASLAVVSLVGLGRWIVYRVINGYYV